MHRRPLLIPALSLAFGAWCAGQIEVDGLELGVMSLLAFDLARRLRSRVFASVGCALLAAAAMGLAAPPGLGAHPLDALATGATVRLRGTTAAPPDVYPDGSWRIPLDLERPRPGRVQLRGHSRRGAGASTPPPPGAWVDVKARIRASRTTHTPGQSDRAARDRRAGCGWSAWVTGPPTVRAGSPTTTTRVRRSARRFFNNRLEPPTDGLALALALGDRSRLSPDLRETFARSGTAHLLAISGLHVGIVALCAAWLCTQATVRVRWLRHRVAPSLAGVICGACAALAYGSLTGWAVSTRRAALMAAVLVLAFALRRRPDPLQVCAVAFAALVLASPADLWSPATALSFGSVVALLRLATMDRARPIRTMASASAAATLGTAPLQLGLFGFLPLVAVPANLLAIPVLGSVLVPLLLAAMVLGQPWPTVGTSLLAAADAIARAGCGVLELAALGPALTASPPPALVAISCAGIGTALCLRRRWHRWIGALAAAGLALLPLHPGSPPTGELSLTALSVGHGEALLLSTADGRRVLVDAGGSFSGADPGERIVVPALRRMGVDHLDALVLTHLHMDHHGGMAAVLRDISVDLLLLPALPPSDHPVAELARLAAARGVPVRLLPHGGGDPTREANAHSLVLRATHGERSFLLTGDIEASREHALVQGGHPLAADVLAVPHHGSATSSTPAFVRAVRPRIAIASVDPRSRHALPRPSVVQRYREQGTVWLTTGQHGTIQVSTDGSSLRHRRFRLPRGWGRWETVPTHVDDAAD
jgi:competence protein ComEC